jgi:hypothetical protein
MFFVLISQHFIILLIEFTNRLLGKTNLATGSNCNMSLDLQTRGCLFTLTEQDLAGTIGTKH